MAFFNTKQIKTVIPPIPDTPPYIPPTPPVAPTPAEGDTPHIPRPTFTGTTNITFYRTNSDNNELNKVLEDAETYSIDIKDSINIITPVILIDTAVDLKSYNYAFIDGLDRYYYIDSVDLLNGTLYKLNLSVDVLMSFKTGIKAMKGILVKTNDERYVNYDLNDGSFINQEGKVIEVQVFPKRDKTFLDNPVNILIACG